VDESSVSQKKRSGPSSVPLVSLALASAECDQRTAEVVAALDDCTDLAIVKNRVDTVDIGAVGTAADVDVDVDVDVGAGRNSSDRESMSVEASEEQH